MRPRRQRLVVGWYNARAGWRGDLQIVYVAGIKVRTDLFTIPFSKGLNLICIHSKKYIEDDPETKPQKTKENLLAMQVRHRTRGPCDFRRPLGVGH
jgi:glycerol-3-phosphate O-acyltransferase